MRRWRRAQVAARQPSAQPREKRPAPRRGRPPQPATRDQRDAVYRWLKERGPATPLAALRAEFPQVRRVDLNSALKRYRKLMRHKAARHQSRLEWRRAGLVWAADFKERREPLEGRYGWILSIKDLGSRCQLAWEPLVEATAEVVQVIYTRLFEEHGPPMVLKSDNGGQFKADATKELLCDYRVLPLYSPKRHPQYNGGVERANGQVASYQEAIAAHHQRPAGPTWDDAAAARETANDLAYPRGWQGPTARAIWEERPPITPDERDAFLAEVDWRRAAARDHWKFAPEAEAELNHYEAAAVDRRAIRETLVAQEFLVIHPKRKRKRKRDAGAADASPAKASRGNIGRPAADPTVNGALAKEMNAAEMNAAPARQDVSAVVSPTTARHEMSVAVVSTAVRRLLGNPSRPRAASTDEVPGAASPPDAGSCQAAGGEQSVTLAATAAQEMLTATAPPPAALARCASSSSESPTARAPQAHGAGRIVVAAVASSHDDARLEVVTAPSDGGARQPACRFVTNGPMLTPLVGRWCKPWCKRNLS